MKLPKVFRKLGLRYQVHLYLIKYLTVEMYLSGDHSQ